MSISKFTKTAGLVANVAGLNVTTVFDIAFYSLKIIRGQTQLGKGRIRTHSLWMVNPML